MARVITENLHGKILKLIGELKKNVSGKQKAILTEIYNELDNADNAPGYED